MTTELKIEEQINILESILKEFVETKGFPLSVIKTSPMGLCYYFSKKLEKLKYRIFYYSEISGFFPLFQRKHANEIKQTRDSGYWYEVNPYDFDNRHKFLVWMLDTLKREVNNNSKEKI